MNNNRQLIMVTNDDGVDAKGLRYLIETLCPLGDVIAVAPDGPRSGQSSAITVEQPLRLRECPRAGGAQIWAVNGTPVDCVKLGLHAVMPRRPDIIVSGINHGSNAGNSVIYSGTMGAVMEGSIRGIQSVGFSLLHHSPDADFSHCGPFVTDITARLLAKGLPEGVCLNVNIPANGAPEGLKVTRAARGYWTEEYAEYTDPAGRPYWWLTGRFVNTEPEADDTDEYWLARNWATAVPVRIDQSATDIIGFTHKTLTE